MASLLPKLLGIRRFRGDAGAPVPDPQTGQRPPVRRALCDLPFTLKERKLRGANPGDRSDPSESKQSLPVTTYTVTFDL